MKDENNQIEFRKVMDALLDDDALFPVEYFVEFSDIKRGDLVLLKNIWHQITPQRKAKLFENLELIYETDFTKDFSQVAILGLDDLNGVIRASSIRLLDEVDSRRFIQPLIEMLENDTDINVRAQAASALGRFVYLGELEEIPEEDYQQIEEVLLCTLADEASELVRQKALESIGFSGRDEIKSFIQNAFLSTDNNWIKSAVVAMGRSADEFWEDKVLTSLIHPNLFIQLEAIRAAGELEIKSARKLLLKFIMNDELDEDARIAAIWSLSKIGGEGVDVLFQKLMDETEDEMEIMFLEDAMDNLQLTNGFFPELDFLQVEKADPTELREFSFEDDEASDLSDILFQNSWIEEMMTQLEDDEHEEEDYEERFDDEDPKDYLTS